MILFILVIATNSTCSNTEETAVPECRQEEGPDREATCRAGRVYFPQEAKTRRAGGTQLWLSGLEDSKGGDKSSWARDLNKGRVLWIVFKWSLPPSAVCICSYISWYCIGFIWHFITKLLVYSGKKHKRSNNQTGCKQTLGYSSYLGEENHSELWHFYPNLYTSTRFYRPTYCFNFDSL